LTNNSANQHNERDQSSIYSFFNILTRRGGYIVVCLLAVLLPVIYYNQTATPTYSASTTVIYEEPHSVIGTTGTGEFYTKESLLNQIQEIQSRSVALEVMDALPRQVLKTIPLPEELEEGFDLRKYYAAIIKDNITATPVAESDVIQVDVKANDAYSAMTIANTVADVLAERNLRLRREEVSGVRAHIEEQLKLYRQKLDNAETQLRRFKERNQVTSLNKEVEEVLQRATHVDKLYAEAKTDRDKIENNLKSINDRISASQQNLVPSIADISTQVVQQLQAQLTARRNQYIRLQLQGVPETNSKMVQLRSEMDQLRDDLAEEARKIAEAQNVIDPLSQMASLYERKINLELELETVQAQEQSLVGEIERYEGNLRQLPGKEYELARLTRERDLASDIYVMLSNRWEEARINEAEKVGNLRIIDRAELPKHPVSPRKRLNLAIGFIFGLTMGLGLAFFLESLDTSIKTPEEVERKTGLTIIGSIPRIRMPKSKKDSKQRHYQSLSDMLITYSIPGSPASEAYRTLRTNLQFSEMADNLRTFMISSSGPKEGKSTTIANLAITTAQMGLRTLLIDADLRRPTIHQMFSLQREPGLADILMHFYKNDEVANNGGQEELSEEMEVGSGSHIRQASVRARKTVQQIASLDLAITAAVQPTPTDKLEVLTCGLLPPNPSEVLASETMKDLLALVRERYEIVVIDAPPIIAVTDAAVLAPQVDGVALVIESGRNDKEIIQKAKSLLERVGAKVLGAILNNVQEKNLYGDYDYYYTYYTKESN
jgi:uncharacterized protein involved in exopolysaccharide biosynthesis/Mrp family chromosome partitioning ATPase